MQLPSFALFKILSTNLGKDFFRYNRGGNLSPKILSSKPDTNLREGINFDLWLMRHCIFTLKAFNHTRFKIHLHNTHVKCFKNIVQPSLTYGTGAWQMQTWKYSCPWEILPGSPLNRHLSFSSLCERKLAPFRGIPGLLSYVSIPASGQGSCGPRWSCLPTYIKSHFYWYMFELIKGTIEGLTSA